MKKVTLEQLEEVYNELLALQKQGKKELVAITGRKLLEGVLLFLLREYLVEDNTKYSASRLMRIFNIKFKEFLKPSMRAGLISKMTKLLAYGNRAAHWALVKDNDINVNDIVRISRELIDYCIEVAERRVDKQDAYTEKYWFIKNIDIQELVYFKDVSFKLASPKQFIVLLGENGIGKTLFLQFLALVLHQNNREIYPSLIELNNETPSSSSFDVFTGDQKSFFLIDALTNDDVNSKRSNVIAYGASRLQLQGSESMAEERLRKNSIYNIFKTDAPLLNIEEWLTNKLINDEDEFVQAILSVLSSLMPNIDRIEYKKDKEKGYRFEYQYEIGTNTTEELSAGHKNILGLFGDMLIRLFDSNPEATTIKELKGIVLIDELEAHLHPSWQRKLPVLLTEYFPNVQFIVSTHTPMTLLGLPNDIALLHISKGDQKASIKEVELDIQNMTPQQLLTSPLFGLETIRSLYSESLEDLETAENYQELLKRKEVKDRIKSLSANFKFKEPEE